jgi:hypothetical protein
LVFLSKQGYAIFTSFPFPQLLILPQTTNENKDFRFIKLYGLHNEMVYAFEKGKEYLASKKSKSLPDKEDKFLDNLRSIIKSQP